MTITIPQAARRLRPGATRRRLAATEQALAQLDDLADSVRHTEAMVSGFLAAFAAASGLAEQESPGVDGKRPALRVLHRDDSVTLRSTE